MYLSYYLYHYYKEGEVTFYLGHFASPLIRLQEHLGKGTFRHRPTSLGLLIQSHLPEALTWPVDLLMCADCASFVAQYRPEEYEWFKHPLGRFRMDPVIVAYVFSFPLLDEISLIFAIHRHEDVKGTVS